MGPTSLQRLNEVNPLLAAKIKQLEKDLGQPLGVTQGLRTGDEQAALYAQGRQSLDEVNALRKKVNWAPITEAQNRARVTNADRGESYHEFGLAVDVVPEALDTGAPDWNVTHQVWKDLVVKGEALGMTSGKSWGDEPHFQLQGNWPVNKPPVEAAQLLANGNLTDVWSASGVMEQPPVQSA